MERRETILNRQIKRKAIASDVEIVVFFQGFLCFH